MGFIVVKQIHFHVFSYQKEIKLLLPFLIYMIYAQYYIGIFSIIKISGEIDKQSIEEH